jgi:hypothetical protein
LTLTLSNGRRHLGSLGQVWKANLCSFNDTHPLCTVRSTDKRVMAWILQGASKSSKSPYLFSQCHHTLFGTISICSSPNQLHMHAFDQVHKPPQPPRQHMSYSSMCPQGTVDIQCIIRTKSTFEICCTVGSQPKFALVDTFSHASCKNRRNVGKQSTFPTT